MTAVVGALAPPRFLGDHRPTRRRSLLLRASVPLGLLLVWQLSSLLGLLSPQVLAAPSEVIGAVRELAASGQLFDFLVASLRRIAIGVSIGLALGTFLGLLAGVGSLGDQLIDPTMQMYRAVPFLALVPLLLTWFGVDETFKIVLIAASALAPMYAYTYLGVRGVDRQIIEAARGYGVSGVALIREVIAPSALPSLLMGVRISLSVSLTGLIAAEQIGTTEGIGYLVALAQQYFRTDYMVLCILMYAVLGLVFDALVRVAEQRAMPWRREGR